MTPASGGSWNRVKVEGLRQTQVQLDVGDQMSPVPSEGPHRHRGNEYTQKEMTGHS